MRETKQAELSSMPIPMPTEALCSASESRERSLRPLIVSFSGVDGAGKSTQIENLRQHLEASGFRVRLFAFWDDVVVGCRFREGFVHKAYKSERGIGEPGKPVARRDKNVRRWYLTLLRHLLYFADALNLAWVVFLLRYGLSSESAERSGAGRSDSGSSNASRADAGRADAGRSNERHVIIFDRYIYDELANLPLPNPLTRFYIKLIQLIVPRPNLAYLLDADPEAARARKPEYPVDFLQHSRRAYKDLALLMRCMTFIPALPLADAKRRVEQAFWLVGGRPALVSAASAKAPAAESRGETRPDEAPAA